MNKLLGMSGFIAVIILLNGCGDAKDEQVPVSPPSIQDEETETPAIWILLPEEEEAPVASPPVEEPASVEEPAGVETTSDTTTLESKEPETTPESVAETVAEAAEPKKRETISFTNSSVGTSTIQQISVSERGDNWGGKAEEGEEEAVEEEVVEEEDAEEENVEEPAGDDQETGETESPAK